MRNLLATLLALCLLAAAAHAATPSTARAMLQAGQDADLVNAEKAAAYCQSPEIKKQSCGWAAKDEPGDFNLGGTMWGGWLPQSKLPYTFPSFSGAFVRVPAERWVSLACRPGRLVVRAVFKVEKVVKEWDGVADVLVTRNELGSLASNPTDITRCELQLPSFKAGDFKSEVDAALRSKEVNCKPKKDSTQKVGEWYSDTGYLTWGGCDALVNKKSAQYRPTVPYIIHNPGPSFIVAKFEVQEA